MRIRSIEASDREFFIDRCHAFYKTPACDHEIPQQNAERTFELLLHGTPYADCLIAEDENGQPCAYCLLALTWSNEAGGLCVWLEEIMVDDERRGKGIGSRLIAAVHERKATCGQVPSITCSALRIWSTGSLSSIRRRSAKQIVGIFVTNLLQITS